MDWNDEYKETSSHTTLTAKIETELKESKKKAYLCLSDVTSIDWKNLT